MLPLRWALVVLSAPLMGYLSTAFRFCLGLRFLSFLHAERRKGVAFFTLVLLVVLGLTGGVEWRDCDEVGADDCEVWRRAWWVGDERWWMGRCCG